MNIDYLSIFGSMRTTITIVATVILVKYYIYLALAPFYPLKEAKRKFSLKRKKLLKDPSYKPKVSVVIPAWNEEVGVLTSVKSVLLSTYDNIEIVVVNDGSTDSTADILQAFDKQYKTLPQDGKQFKFFSIPNGGKGNALNYGIEHSTGEIVLTMDADSAHRSDAIKNLVEYFRDPTVDAVVGNVKVRNNVSLIGLIQKFEYIFGFYFKRVHSLFNAEYIFGGACAAFRRSTTFDALGLFDTQNKTEDIEYSMRTKLHGLKSVFAENVITYTEGASDIKGLYKQRLRWKKGRIDTFIRYRSLFLSRNKKHSKFLSWFVLPYAILGELQMLFEPIFFALIASYTLVSGDYLSIGLSSLFILFTFFASIIFGDHDTSPLYLLLFPSFWILFYLLVGIEFFALVKSLDLVFNKQDVIWQNWNRQGLAKTKLIKKEFAI